MRDILKRDFIKSFDELADDFDGTNNEIGMELQWHEIKKHSQLWDFNINQKKKILVF